MALIKTNYGLRYNDDGSLCMTVRQDDVPFPGVDSWAVEEGTTNLCPSSLRHPNIWTTISYGWGQSGILNVSENEYYAFSADVKNAEEGARWVDIVCRDTNGNKTIPTIISGSGYINSNDEVFGTIESSKIRQNLVLKIPTDTVTLTFYWVSTSNSNTYQGRNFQVEKKPYATSFVDGTREAGKFRIYPAVNHHNFVVNFWMKNSGYTSSTSWDIPIALFLGDSQEKNHISIRGSGPEGHHPILGYYIKVHENSSTEHNIALPNKDTVSDWHMYTFGIDDMKFFVYVDGEKVRDITLATWAPINTEARIGWGTGYFTSTQVASFYTGDYRDKNGNVIWTDDYIKYVYEQKKPFAAHYNIID